MKQFFKSVVTTIVPLWFFIMSLMYYGIFIMGKKSQPAAITTPVKVEYFKAGDTLLPDYVCPDTLIVRDADGLNKGMALVEQGYIDATDYQIDSILHTHCAIK